MRVRSGPVALSLEVQYMLLHNVTECPTDWLDTRQTQEEENWSLFVKITIKKNIKICLQNAEIYKVTAVGT